MEKQDSLAVTVKGDFPDNESFTTEPPPAYRQPRSSAVQVARIVAVTVVLASAILGSCLLASAWIQARATCELMLMEHQLQEAESRAAGDQGPQYQALVQDSQTASTPEEASSSTSAPHEATSREEEPSAHQENDVHRIKLPLQLDFDELAGSLMEKNQRAHMNCVVEKRRSEELVDHAPRALRLPFGLNLTTPPRLEHLTGERMVISCESGQDHQRQMPMPMGPVMIPLPGPMHPPMSFHGPPQMHHQMPQNMPDGHVAMIVEHHSGPNSAPVPLSAMSPPPQHQPEHMVAESRGFAGFPIPIQIREYHGGDDESEQEHHQQGPQGRALFPGLPLQIRQINVHEPPPAPEHMRPHYVQPRSVPSNPDFLQPAKRVKRCACNCDC